MKHIIEQLKKYMNEADAIVIGAGAGLSNAAGFEYGGTTFLENFKWIISKLAKRNGPIGRSSFI